MEQTLGCEEANLYRENQGTNTYHLITHWPHHPGQDIQ